MNRVRCALSIGGALCMGAVLGAGSLVASGTAGATGSSGIHIVTTTPAPKGKVSSITWDLANGEPATLTNVKSGTYSPTLVIENMCDDVLRLTPSFGIKPALASSWHYTNPTTLVFQIRKGVYFWNGQELTATDVAYSLLRNMNPKDGSLYGTYYHEVKSISATGPYQVTVTFTKPDELFLQVMATVTGAVNEKSYVEKAGATYGTSKGGVMCTGPYEFTKWTAGNDIVLKANPHYWTKSWKPRIKTITVKWLSNTSTLTSALLSGEIQGVYSAPATSYSELESASDGKLYFGKSTHTTFLAPTSTTGPIGNQKIREALSLAIDRSAIAKVVYDNAALPIETLTPHTISTAAAKKLYASAYAKLPSTKPNIAKAKRLVASVPDHSQPITLALLTGDQTDLAEATAVQEAGKRIGLNIKLDEISYLNYYNALYSATSRKGIDLLLTQNGGYIATALTLLDSYFPKGTVYNYITYTNPTVNSDLAKAQETNTGKARARLITGAQALYTRALYVLPVVNPYMSLFLNKSITGAPVTSAYVSEPCFARLGAAK